MVEDFTFQHRMILRSAFQLPYISPNRRIAVEKSLVPQV